MARMVVRNALFFAKGKMSAMLIPWTTFTQVCACRKRKEKTMPFSVNKVKPSVILGCPGVCASTPAATPARLVCVQQVWHQLVCMVCCGKTFITQGMPKLRAAASAGFRYDGQKA